MRKRGLGGFFNKIYGSPLKKYDVVRMIINDEEVNPKEAVYIGDAISDYKAARDNLVGFVARMTTENKDLFKDIDCIKVDDLTDFKEIIGKL